LRTHPAIAEKVRLAFDKPAEADALDASAHDESGEPEREIDRWWKP
jgi:hypothetical protein